MKQIKMIIINAGKLFSCIKILSLKGDQLRLYSLWFPTFLALIFYLIGVVVFGRRFLGDETLNYFTDLSGVLVGFFLACLLAVASFGNSRLDYEMAGDAPMAPANNKDGKWEKITRRRFLCMLFGWCVGLSVVLFLLGVLMAQLMPDPLMCELENSNDLELTCLFAELLQYLYLWVVCGIFVSASLGMHYLVDRMHRD